MDDCRLRPRTSTSRRRDGNGGHAGRHLHARNGRDDGKGAHRRELAARGSNHRIDADLCKGLLRAEPRDGVKRLGSRRYDLAKVRERLKMPILCIEGEEDTLIVPEMIRLLVKALP